MKGTFLTSQRYLQKRKMFPRVILRLESSHLLSCLLSTNIYMIQSHKYLFIYSMKMYWAVSSRPGRVRGAFHLWPSVILLMTMFDSIINDNEVNFQDSRIYTALSRAPHLLNSWSEAVPSHPQPSPPASPHPQHLLLSYSEHENHYHPLGGWRQMTGRVEATCCRAPPGGKAFRTLVTSLEAKIMGPWWQPNMIFFCFTLGKEQICPWCHRSHGDRCIWHLYIYTKSKPSRVVKERGFDQGFADVSDSLSLMKTYRLSSLGRNVATFTHLFKNSGSGISLVV